MGGSSRADVSRDVVPTGTNRTAAEKALDQPRVKLLVLLGLAYAVHGTETSLWDFMLERYQQDWQEVGHYAAYMQAFVLVVGGLFWGVLASQDVLTRKQLITTMCVVYGLNCLIEPMLDGNVTLHIGLHLLVKFFIAPLWPLCRSIVADVFGAKTRSEIYGLHYVCFYIALRGTRWVLGSMGGHSGGAFGYYSIAFGCISLLVGALIYFFMWEPPIVPSKRSIVEEFRTLSYFFTMPTFFILVFQGSFGAIPWKALDKQIELFTRFGLQGATAEGIHTLCLFAAAGSTIVGGYVGDRLARRSMLHGRIACAEMSVFGGIPLAFLLYCVSPDYLSWVESYLSLPAGIYFGTMVVVFGLVVNWPISGTIPQLLYSISNADQRVFAFVSHWALQEASAFVGWNAFKFLFEELSTEDPDPVSLGFALFLSHAVPWLICGLLFSLLHFTYPRDVERTMMASHGPRLMNHQVSELSVMTTVTTLDNVSPMNRPGMWGQVAAESSQRSQRGQESEHRAAESLHRA